MPRDSFIKVSRELQRTNTLLPNTVSKRRPRMLPMLVVLAFASGGVFAYKNRDELLANSEVSESPLTCSEAVATAAMLNPETATTAQMIPLRDACSIDERFIQQINGINYAWPVGRPHQGLFKIALPCNIIDNDPLCHGNDPSQDASFTAATDFVYRDGGNAPGTIEAIVGEPVYAFTDGVIERVDPGKDEPNCNQIGLRSINGRYYWYGHVDNPSVSVGTTVTAGQQIAEVGGPECAKSRVAHLHLDINGTPGKRHPQFILEIQTVYNQLP